MKYNICVERIQAGTVPRIISLISFTFLFHFLKEVLLKSVVLAHILSSIALHTYLICSLLIYSTSITSFLFDANDLLNDFESRNDSPENQDKCTRLNVFTFLKHAEKIFSTLQHSVSMKRKYLIKFDINNTCLEI